MSEAKLIVGLGNPDSKYAKTRHNVGFRILDAFAEAHDARFDQQRFQARFASCRVEEHQVYLLQPQTWMNRCGISVADAVEALHIDDLTRNLIVVYDDLDLSFGRLRLRPSGGPGGHRGVSDVIEHLGSQRFGRLRFGIGRPPASVDPVAYVLESFSLEELQQLESLGLRATQALEVALLDGLSAAMEHFNASSDI